MSDTTDFVPASIGSIGLETDAVLRTAERAVRYRQAVQAVVCLPAHRHAVAGAEGAIGYVKLPHMALPGLMAMLSSPVEIVQFSIK